MYAAHVATIETFLHIIGHQGAPSPSVLSRGVGAHPRIPGIVHTCGHVLVDMLAHPHTHTECELYV